MEAGAGSAPELRLSQLSMIVGDVQFLHAITQLHKLDTFTCSKTNTVLHKKNVIMVLQKVLILLSIQLPPSIVTVHHVVGISHMLLAPSSHFFSRHSRHCSLA